MATELFEQLGSELSLFRQAHLPCTWNQSLHFCKTHFASRETQYQPTADDDLLDDVFLKLLRRGRRPLTPFFTERAIIAAYGDLFSIRDEDNSTGGSIKYAYDDRLKTAYSEFVDVVDPWDGNLADVEFDPKHPENERELFRGLIDTFGNRIAACTTPQVDLASILDKKTVAGFVGQRADFLLSFPNGAMLVIEPGDHDDSAQVRLDKARDRAFGKRGIQTLRPRNEAIRTTALFKHIGETLATLEVGPFLDASASRSPEQLSCNYLFLLPSLVTRVERLLFYFLLRRGLLKQPELRIGIIERDLECAELSIASVRDQLTRLSALYGIDCTLPDMTVFVQRNADYRHGDLSQLEVPVTVCDDVASLQLDLLLDVGIKCNGLTLHETGQALHAGAVRQTFPHTQPVRFAYRQPPRPIQITDDNEELLNSFTRDLFRKRSLRPGQVDILRQVLAHKPTIGLLPTSGGKSLCYQLASLLTPGTTIVVDPIIALMKDQVQSLVEPFGIDRIFAWHSASTYETHNAGSYLSEHLIVFISPERLQRPNFRNAMRGLAASDISINYAVIDEAHCVSMWGHDFRPAYLALERNFREFCTFQGRSPVLVALTGTASQMVLIDLKRELNIQDMDAIIRPDTFNRPELNFNIVSCPNDNKEEALTEIQAAIARRLNVQQLDTEAHGIVFAYIPNELWRLFGLHVANATEHVTTVLAGHDCGEVRYGVYTGSPPSQSGLSAKEWNTYKDRTLAEFKRGNLRVLFGNTAVGVGIDNEQLNYVINYRMPESLEAYYQQCGRAGRSGQRSECYLLHSDDNPQQTQQWLNKEISGMPRRSDDLGTVAYFHSNSFPGIDTDCHGAHATFRQLFATPEADGLIQVPAYLPGDTTQSKAERTERYLSYWIILGVLVDYEVTGMRKTEVFHVRRHPVVEQFLSTKPADDAALHSHMVDNLFQYVSRYRPGSRSQIENKVGAIEKPTLSERLMSVLVQFIYDQIEYQRREAIRTMTGFCAEADTDPERIRGRITAYFDSSDKFSDDLNAMADVQPRFARVATVLDRVLGFDDAEQLYWETRRLLDERFRPDWSVANLFATAYRSRAETPDGFMQLLDDTASNLVTDQQMDVGEVLSFLGGFLGYLVVLDRVFEENFASAQLICNCISHLEETHGLPHTQLIEEMSVTDEHRAFFSLFMVNIKIKDFTNANHSRVARRVTETMW